MPTETNWTEARVMASKNRNIAVIIMLSALVVIVLGIVYYRFDRRRRQAKAERISTNWRSKRCGHK
ncbi:MAG: hypothetical protein IPI91_16680 [Flavobacteriales bacterium]|nr:hypothetical protein [Flavobacteriales bacterium]